MSPRSPLRRSAFALGLFCTALFGACDGGGPTQAREPDVADGIRVIAGANMTDTIDAILHDDLTVAVTRDGQLGAGAQVFFTALPLADCVDCTIPTAWVAPSSRVVLSPSAVVVADARGEASVQVRLGTAAGTGRLRVAVPSQGFDDTLTFTVHPGNAVRTRVLPRDSVVYLNTSLRMRAAVVDRGGNARGDAFTLAVAGPGLALAGDVVTASVFGVGKVTVTAPGLPVDSVRVMVVPHGTLAATTDFRKNAVAVFDLDGSHRSTLSLPPRVNGMDWAPDGTRLVVSLGEPTARRKLYSVTLAGAQTEMFAGSALTDASRPVFSANGQWMYFVGTATLGGGGEIWRSRADGSGLERVGTGQELAKSVAPSPDGSRVAYSRATFADPLQVLTAATGQVASFDLITEGVRWSPRADRLALRRIGGPATVRLDGTGLRSYTEYHGVDDPFSPWSPDGDWIVYHNGATLELIQVDTGLRIPLPYSVEFTQAAWKP